MRIGESYKRVCFNLIFLKKKKKKKKEKEKKEKRKKEKDKQEIDVAIPDSRTIRETTNSSQFFRQIIQKFLLLNNKPPFLASSW